MRNIGNSLEKLIRSFSNRNPEQIHHLHRIKPFDLREDKERDPKRSVLIAIECPHCKKELLAEIKV
jgi:hypothetical protein